ncbi:hypothetical protein [Pedobacter sp.]
MVAKSKKKMKNVNLSQDEKSCLEKQLLSSVSTMNLKISANFSIPVTGL